MGRFTPATLRRCIRRPASTRAGQRGMTLIEIVIAILILAIMAIGMSQFFTRGRIGFGHEEQKRIGVLLAQEALERTVSRPYTQIIDWSELRTIDATNYTVAVTTLVDAPEQDMKTIHCTVTWNLTPQETRSASLETFVFEN